MRMQAIAALLALSLIASAQANDQFTGDTKLACEAVLCLSTGKRPDECSPSVKRYFSIKFKKSWKTAAKRKEFLQMCPQGDATPEQMDKALKQLELQTEDDDNAEE
jgi:hypothetical protein